MGFHGEVRVQCGSKNLKFIRELNVCRSDITGIETGKNLSFWEMPNKMATDFIELRVMPFSQITWLIFILWPVHSKNKKKDDRACSILHSDDDDDNDIYEDSKFKSIDQH